MYLHGFIAKDYNRMIREKLTSTKHIKLEKLHDNLNIQIHREVKIIQN